MRIAIISDAHANLEALRATLDDIDSVGVDEIYHLGDIVGYCASPNQCIELLGEREISSVMGNHDAVACGIDESAFWNRGARTAIEWTRQSLNDYNRKVLSELPDEISISDNCIGVHGAPGDRDHYIEDNFDAMNQFARLDGRPVHVCFFGHTHKPVIYSEYDHTFSDHGPHKLFSSNRYMINPGGVGQPRDRDPRAAWLLYDTDDLTITFYRTEYDIGKTQKKIREKGLPDWLARRLEFGR